MSGKNSTIGAFKAVRLAVYSVILLCVVVSEFSAKSNSSASPGSLRHTLTGDIRLHRNFYSRFLHNSRDVIVYLPPGYSDEANDRRYPVLYMQDGQNIFDAATSFFALKERHMDEEAQKLITEHTIQPLIIVGIYSVTFDRINEYTPTRQAGSNVGGRADIYGRMLVEELKPFIDAQYRTLPDRSHTALGGASLGGLATAYLGLKYSNVFSKLSITSPAAYWDNRMIVRYVESLPAKTDQHISLSVGGEEPDEFLGTTRALHQALLKKGWTDGINLGYMEAAGAQHMPDESAKRVNYSFRFLFPASH